MNQSIDDLPIEITIEIISNLSSYIADYLPLRLVSSRWKYSIDCYFATIKHLVHRNIERKDVDNKTRVTKDGLIVCKPFGRLDLVINCIELFPNLKAVSVDFSNCNKRDLDTLFNYLNTRPTITFLDLRSKDHHTKLQNDVKLENIRNFALNAGPILLEGALSRLFQADHKLTQLYGRTLFQPRLPFEEGLGVLKRMPTLEKLSQNFVYLFHDLVSEVDPDYLIDAKQHGLSFENLESYSFDASSQSSGFLNYVDNFVDCCPNLKSVDCWLSGGDGDRIPRLHNLRAHTNVENLVIRVYLSSWKFVFKVLEMFPMIKNLKLDDVEGTGHNQLSQALLKLPNLSLLYLRPLGKRYWIYKDIVQLDCEALKEEYSSKYGRNLQIVRQNGELDFEDFPFRHGFNFMENIFWLDWPPRLLTD